MALLRKAVDRWCSSNSTFHIVIWLSHWMALKIALEMHSQKCTEQCLVSMLCHAKILIFRVGKLFRLLCLSLSFQSNIRFPLYFASVCFSACGCLKRWKKFCDFAFRFVAVLVNSSISHVVFLMCGSGAVCRLQTQQGNYEQKAHIKQFSSF